MRSTQVSGRLCFPAPGSRTPSDAGGLWWAGPPLSRVPWQCDGRLRGGVPPQTRVGLYFGAVLSGSDRKRRNRSRSSEYLGTLITGRGTLSHRETESSVS